MVETKLRLNLLGSSYMIFNENYTITDYNK